MPGSQCAHEFAAFAGSPAYEPALVQRRCRHEGHAITHFARPTDADLASTIVDGLTILTALAEPIPVGLETQVLRRAEPMVRPVPATSTRGDVRGLASRDGNEPAGRSAQPAAPSDRWSMRDGWLSEPVGQVLSEGV
jgi:hypothetical protein